MLSSDWARSDDAKNGMVCLNPTKIEELMNVFVSQKYDKFDPKIQGKRRYFLHLVRDHRSVLQCINTFSKGVGTLGNNNNSA